MKEPSKTSEKSTGGLSSEPVLVDGAGRALRTLRLSVTDRCNHRCLYCMPEQGIPLLPREAIMRLEETQEIVAALASAGIKRVRLTGGEPLVREGILDLAAGIRRIPGIESMALTTNGSLLQRFASGLRKAGLERINVSLDTLRRDRFKRLARRDTLDSVLAGIEAALQEGFLVHLNTVAMKGINDDEFGEICSFAWKMGAVPRFIELMPSGPLAFYSDDKFLPADLILKRIEAFLGLQARPIPSRLGFGPASYYELDPERRFGIIASVTGHICAECDRIRLLATGKLLTCLVRPEEALLKDALARGGKTEVIRRAMSAIRKKIHRNDALKGPPIVMSSVGG